MVDTGVAMKDQGERRQLCVEMEALKQRLFRAGLYLTAHKMNEACQQIGYECFEQFEKETRKDKASR